MNYPRNSFDQSDRMAYPSPAGHPQYSSGYPTDGSPYYSGSHHQLPPPPPPPPAYSQGDRYAAGPPAHAQMSYYPPPPQMMYYPTEPYPQYPRRPQQEYPHYAEQDEMAYPYNHQMTPNERNISKPRAITQQRQSNREVSSRPSAASIETMMRYNSPGDQRPTYIGHIKSAHDAILLLSACDLPPNAVTSGSSAVPRPSRVTRRLLDSERLDMVASGCVFAWDEKEAGMKRWTDGRVWSASRVSGCFLTYRELEARKKSNGAVHEGPSTNQYKPEGLIKQSFSVTTTSGRKLHVISYFTKRDVREGRLRRVSEDPRFVGEGGGEWGLQVDEKEYSFPDGNHHRGNSNGENEGDSQDEDSDDEDATPLSSNDNNHDSGSNTSIETAPPVSNPRKRPLPADVVEPARRPPLMRLRSSSLSGTPSSGRFVNGSKLSSSHKSATSSAATSTQPEAEVRKSQSLRALVSPTLPRESAVRNSACEMQPTQSQDSANAVGALLSLAKQRGKAVSTPPAGSANVSGLGLSVSSRPNAPDRNDSDRKAVNMFEIRV